MGLVKITKEQAQPKIKTVFFEGTTALRKGQALCYNADYGTATSAAESRLSRVEMPTSSNSLWFAGTAFDDYPAASGGQQIRIYEPGGFGYMLAAADCTVNSTMLTFTVASGSGTTDSGWFVKEGFAGRGTAIALQTTTDAVLHSTFDGTGSYDQAGGAASYLIEDTGCGSTTAGTEAGDSVLVLAGDSASQTMGLYTVSSVPSDNAVALTTDIGADATDLHFVILDQDESWAVPCYLFDGPESGGVEFLTMIDNTSSIDPMTYGVTYIHQAALANGNCTGTLGDGARNNQLKGFYVGSTLGTNDYALTVTSGLMTNNAAAGTETCASITFDTAADFSVLQWFWGEWMLIAHDAADLSNS